MKNPALEKFVDVYNTELSIIQSSLITSISSLVYSEFIHNFHERMTPSHRILIPATRNIVKFLSYGSEFSVSITDNIVHIVNDKIKSVPLYKPYSTLYMFSIMTTDEFNTLMKFDFMPNVERWIPAVIRKKFRLDENNQQTFIEDRDRYLFNNDTFTYDDHFDYYEYIADQLILNMLLQSDLVHKEIQSTENMNIIIDDSNVLTIKHENALAQININKQVCMNTRPLELINFVSSTGVHPFKDDFVVDTHYKNKIELYKFE